VWYHTILVCFVVVMWCFTVEIEWCSTGHVGDSADTDVHDAARKWHWTWWRLPCIQVWQVQECWAPSVHHAGVSMLVLASDAGWLATVANQSVGKAPNQETYWAWVSYVFYCQIRRKKTLVLQIVLSATWHIENIKNEEQTFLISQYLASVNVLLM